MAALPPPRVGRHCRCAGGTLMLRILLIGAGIMTVCLLLQSALLVLAIRFYARRHEVLSAKASSWSTLLVISGVMLILLLGNFAQIGIWALVFLWAEEFGTIRDAVYPSAANFSSLGYGDIVMS